MEPDSILVKRFMNAVRSARQAKSIDSPGSYVGRPKRASRKVSAKFRVVELIDEKTLLGKDIDDNEWANVRRALRELDG